MFEGLAQNETGLGHDTLDRVHQQEHGIHHPQHSLDLAPKIGVPGGIDQLNAYALVVDGRSLRLDGDPPLPLEVPGVHDSILDDLMGREGAARLQESVHESRLAMIDMRHDGEVAQICSGFGIRHDDCRLEARAG